MKHQLLIYTVVWITFCAICVQCNYSERQTFYFAQDQATPLKICVCFYFSIYQLARAESPLELWRNHNFLTEFRCSLWMFLDVFCFVFIITENWSSAVCSQMCPGALPEVFSSQMKQCSGTTCAPRISAPHQPPPTWGTLYIPFPPHKREFNVGHCVHIQGYARKSVHLGESRLGEICLRGKCMLLLFLSVPIKLDLKLLLLV